MALKRIKHECLNLQTIEIFDTNFVHGYTTLEDFKHAQEHYIHKSMRKIIDGYPQLINDIIREELKIDKENKPEVLDQDRFRRFIDLVEHYMKDALE